MKKAEIIAQISSLSHAVEVLASAVNTINEMRVLQTLDTSGDENYEDSDAYRNAHRAVRDMFHVFMRSPGFVGFSSKLVASSMREASQEDARRMLVESEEFKQFIIRHF